MPVLTGWIGHAFDVAIVGAGAAGLSAARHIQDARPDLSVIVIEAGRHLGGRAHTLALPGLDQPVDLGCGWLHGARTNGWTAVAGDLGFAIDKTPPAWDGPGRDLDLSGTDEAAAEAALSAFFRRLDAIDPAEPDRPMSAALEPGSPWNGYLDAIGTYINGTELANASARDFNRYDPGPSPDWRVRQGYGRLVETFGAAVPVVAGVAVTRIDHGGRDGVTLGTDEGTLACRAAIVTVSSNVIASEAIRFDPPLPDKAAAAAGLPLGLANKLFLRLAEADTLPAEHHLLGSPHRTGTGAYHLRPFGAPIIEGYFGGTLARDLEEAGPAAAFDFAAGELADHFGAAIRPRLSPLAFSGWARRAWIGGSYSYARPGSADARETLGRPVGDRLFFAGEACSPKRFSTAHGARETGIAAAESCLTLLA